MAALWLPWSLYTFSVIFLDRPPGGYYSFWDGWLHNGIYVMIAAALCVNAMRSSHQRAGMVWLACGAGLNTIAQLVYFFHDRNLDPAPFPALSDVFTCRPTYRSSWGWCS